MSLHLNKRSASLPFDRPTNIGPSPTGAELGASPLAGAESAHAAAAGAHAHMAAEAVSLGQTGTAAVGHAALAGIAGAAEPISPIIQMIMKMPGATGIMNSFFEFLSGLFFPAGLDLGSLIGGLDPSLFNVLGGVGDAITNTLQGLGDGSLIQNLNVTNLGGAAGGFDLNHFGTSNSIGMDHFKVNPANVGAQDLGTAQFEGLAKASGGALAGPAVNGVTNPNFLAGNNRLFSDQIGGRGFTSVTSATNVPTTTGAVPNSSGVTFGQEAMQHQMARMPEGAVSGPAVGDAGGMQLANHAQPSIDTGSSLTDRLGSNNVVAGNDVPAYRPSTGELYNPQQSSSMGDVAGIKAKALSFEDLRKGVVGNHASRLMDQIAGAKHNAIDHIGHQAKGIPGGADGIAKPSVNKAFSTGHAAPDLSKAAHHHHAPTAHAKPAVSQPRMPEVRQQAAPQQEMAQQQEMQPQEMPQDGSQVVTDQTQIAQAGDQPSTYTVEKGDSLWEIAKKRLGDGSKWSEIYNLNKDVLGSNPDLIFSGTELKLPGMTEVADAGKYIVQPGDNLWSIAKNQLGDANKWGDVFKTNAEVIGSDPRLIMPGQELSLPGAGGESLTSAQMPNIDPSNTAGMQAAQVPADFQSAQSGGFMQQQAASGMQTGSPMDMQTAAQQQMQMPMQQVAPQQMQMPANTMGTIPASANGMITVQPSQELPMGPGAAGASGYIKPIDNSVVSSGAAPDLSFLGKKPAS